MHVDLIGLVRTLSLGGKKYIKVLVDDFSKWSWVTFFIEKTNTCESKRNLCQRIQNEKALLITKIRNDHGRSLRNHNSQIL